MTLLCTKCDSEVIDASRDEIAQMRARIADLEAELAAVRVEAERYRTQLFNAGAMDKPPCFACGYNGPGYYQPDTHPCATEHHAAIAARGAA